MKATVVISTKNRKDDLRVALKSASEQSVHPEVLVIDDGSTDGTQQMVQVEFPHVRLHRFERSRGYIAGRNTGARLASGEVILSIDDDAAFSSRFVVEQTMAEFDSPHIGAVAVPFINLRKENVVRQKAPDTTAVWFTSSFIGTAHAIKRATFLELGGYREHLVHQGEELDFCIRLLHAGYFVRLGNADPIHHFESPKRDFRRMDLYGRRNDVLFAWHNVPWSWLPWHLIGTTVNGFLWGLKVGRPLRMCYGMVAGYAACVRFWRSRTPVTSDMYRMFRNLQKRGAFKMVDIGFRK